MSETASPPPSRLALEGLPPKRPLWQRALKVVALLTLCGAVAAGVTVAAVYYKYAGGLPDIPRVDEYSPAVLSEVLTQDAVLAGEFYNERRKVIPYERIPKRLVQAFIASEDSSFFDHGGVDLLGTTRAAFNTLRKKLGLGGSVQGGSTLTQQTAKAVLIDAAMRGLDAEAMMAEAEKRAPAITPPTKEQLAAEVAQLKAEYKKAVVMAQGEPPPEPTPEQLLTAAKARLLAQAEEARDEEVMRHYFRVRAEWRRKAFKEATAKTIERKIREAILARRLEAALTKEDILFLYLNNVYLGNHAYGVQAAAENYFRKDVSELTLAEIALIAGLPQAPSRYSPNRNPENAKKRRTYVLRRMLNEGMIGQAEHDKAQLEPIYAFNVEDVFHEFAPYFVEQVRRDVAHRYGNEALLNDGLSIHTTMDSERQRAAQEAMLYGLLAVDKRQGYRGPLQHLERSAWRAFQDEGTKALDGAKIEDGRFYVALVTGVDKAGEVADVTVGHHKGKLPLLGMKWARALNPEGYYPAVLLPSIKDALEPGDVILVRAVAPEGLTDDTVTEDAELRKRLPKGVQLYRLEQAPELQGALVSIDPHRQYLVAMVGGYDFDANEYNRAFQACRQPGSSFKPVVYSAALEELEWTEATIIVDSPIVAHDPSSGVIWKPENYSTEFQGDVLLRTALVNSMNIPAVKTFTAVGGTFMAKWARKLGISTPLNRHDPDHPDASVALGSACVYPVDLAGVYATFARQGMKRPTHFLRKVEDRYGRTLEDHTAYDDPWASWGDRIASGYARLLGGGERVMSKETGFIMVDLLRGVVKEGTAVHANRLGKPAYGKTGTTNDSFDAWFAGFTEDLVAVSWVGYDLNPHPLGRYETGGRASLPIWLAYMKRALEGMTQEEIVPLPGADLVKLKVDNKTGKLASKASAETREMWFKRGTEPEEKTPEPGQVDSGNFMMIDQNGF